MRTVFDVVLFEPESTPIAHDVLVTCLREHDQAAPIIVITSDDDVGGLIAATFEQRRN